MTDSQALTTITFTPTLYVFLGSSSAEIGWRLKKLQVDAYGDIPIYQHLWIDTDSKTTPEIDSWLKNDTVRRISIGDVDTTLILENLPDFSEIEAWWPKNNTDDPVTLVDGAKQIRINGRLGLFGSFMRPDDRGGFPVRDVLQNTAQAVTGIQEAQVTQKMTFAGNNYQVNYGQVRVYIVNSMCGGTGSGISFDISYLLRKFFLSSTHKVSIIGVNLLPPVFERAIGPTDAAQKEKVKANGYSYLQDLDYLITKRNWNVRYPTLEVNLKAAPFDYVYVVDLANKSGQYLNDPMDVYKMTSQALFLLSVTPIAAAQISSLVNTPVHDRKFRGKLPYLNSFGAASLIFPKERLRDYCATRLTIDAIDSVLSSAYSDAGDRPAHVVLIEELKIKPFTLVDAIQKGRRVVNDKLEFIRDAEDPGDAISYITSELGQDRNELSHNEKLFTTTADDIKKILKAELSLKVNTMNANHGPRYAQAVVDMFDKGPSSQSISAFRSQIPTEEKLQEDIDKEQDDLDQAVSKLGELSKQFGETVFKWILKREWRNRFETIKSDVINTMDKLNQAKERKKIYTLIRDIYVSLSTDATEISLLLDRFSKQLIEVQSELKRESDLLLKPDSQSDLFELSKEVVDKKYFLDYYDERKKTIDANHIYANFINSRDDRSINSLKSFTISTLREDLVKTAEIPFEQALKDVDVMSEMFTYYGAKAFSQKLKEKMDSMRDYCLPFWRYKYSASNLFPMSPQYIGVEDANSTMIPAAYRSDSSVALISTGIKDAIFFARSEHGIPTWMLTELPVWRKAYDDHRASGAMDPLNVISSATRNDLDPNSSKATAGIWALALAFGYVVNRRNFFYFDEKQELMKGAVPDPANLIGQGREKAEAEFRVNHDWVNKARKLINDHIDRIGDKEAVRLLQKYYDKLNQEKNSKTPKGSTRKQLERELESLETALGIIKSGQDV